MNEETKQMERFLAEHLNVYIKDKHTQEECVGFIDGFKEALKQVKKLNIHDVSQQRELLNALADKFNESTHTYVGQPMIEETLKAFNCG